MMYIKNGITLLMLVVIVASLVACSSSEQRRKAEENKEEAISTNVRMAGIYMQRGQLGFAKEKAEKALSIAPENTHANHVMALLQWRFKDYEKADRYFRASLQAGPDNSRALNNYGQFFCERGEVDKAVPYFDRAVANPLYKGKAQAYINAGRCLLKKPDLRNAEVYFRKALQMAPRQSAALYQMAKLSFRADKVLSARGFITRYFEVGKDTAESLYLAIRIEKTMGNDKSAASYAMRLRSKFPKSPEAARIGQRTRKKK